MSGQPHPVPMPNFEPLNPKPKVLMIDNYDSFTWNVYQYLCLAGADVTVYRNDQITLAAIAQAEYDGIVLSPGPNRPADAGLLMAVIDRFHAQLPMLGICLGMQALGEYFGARLVKAAVPMHGKQSPLCHTSEGLFAGVEQGTPVMRYHSLVLEDLPEPLIPTAWTPEGTLMALRHRDYALWGMQFHPESILTKDGQAMLQNWVQDAILEVV